MTYNTCPILVQAGHKINSACYTSYSILCCWATKPLAVIENCILAAAFSLADTLPSTVLVYHAIFLDYLLSLWPETIAWQQKQHSDHGKIWILKINCQDLFCHAGFYAEHEIHLLLLFVSNKGGGDWTSSPPPYCSPLSFVLQMTWHAACRMKLLIFFPILGYHDYHALSPKNGTILDDKKGK